MVLHCTGGVLPTSTILGYATQVEKIWAIAMSCLMGGCVKVSFLAKPRPHGPAGAERLRLGRSIQRDLMTAWGSGEDPTCRCRVGQDRPISQHEPTHRYSPLINSELSWDAETADMCDIIIPA